MHKQVVFFGSSPLSNIVLQKLIDAKAVSAVVTKADKPVGRGQKLTPNPVKVLAEKNDIPVSTTPLPPPNLGGGGSQAEGGTTIALVAAYGKIIPQSVLDTFGGQMYNIHPSILPKYRGPSPLQQQILDGVTETGVTLIKLDAEMDHGPIVAQSASKIAPDDTWLTLGERLFAEGTDLIINSQFLIFNQTPISQNHNEATYTKKITRQDGFLEFAEFENSLKIENLKLKLARMLRAYAGWPGVWTIMPDGKRLKLIAVEPNIMIQIEGKSPQPWPVIQ